MRAAFLRNVPRPPALRPESASPRGDGPES
jgi:hypothetical protein